MINNYQETLFPYAYNVLGSVEDAKDVVQDILLKYISRPKKEIENIKSYLIKSVIHQSINLKNRNKKLVHGEVWLPEPIASDATDNSVILDEVLSYSILVLLEKLNAKERAVFILKEGFEYSHKEIANILEISIENSRKLLSRAKSTLKYIKKDQPGNQQILVDNQVLFQYLEAIRTGNVVDLKNLLNEDISLSADGGNTVNVVSDLTFGKEATSKVLLYVFKTFQEQQDVKISRVNHQPALMFFQNNQLVNCQVFEFEGNTIHHIFSVVDPEKLKTLKGIYNN